MTSRDYPGGDRLPELRQAAKDYWAACLTGDYSRVTEPAERFEAELQRVSRMRLAEFFAKLP